MMEALRSFKSPGFKISIYGSDSPLGLACVLMLCALLPTEVLLTCGATLALLQLLGQISQTKRKTSTSPSKLPPGLPKPDEKNLLHGLHSPSQRPARPRVPPTRAHTAARVPRPAPAPPPARPVQVAADTSDLETGMLGALEAYDAIGPPGDLPKEAMPGPNMRLSNLGNGLLGQGMLPGGVANRVSEVLLSSLPQIRVFNFARIRGTDGNVLPALEVVVFMQSSVVSTACLQERLQRGMRGAKGAGSSGDVLSGQKLQKSVLRHCLSLLVSQGFKFRRSAFKAEAPTVFLLAPLEHFSSEPAVSVELSVNNPLPLLNAALVWEAALVDNRASALVASVQRWADARGLAHVAFGPLNIYAWAHLAIFYLQNQATARMPPLLCSVPPPGLGPDPDREPKPLDAALLQGFFKFLAEDSLWKSGSICLRGISPGHGILIADALRPNFDLGVGLYKSCDYKDPKIDPDYFVKGITRIREEATRALHHFATPGATVADLLARPDFRGEHAESGDTGDVIAF